MLYISLMKGLFCDTPAAERDLWTRIGQGI